MSDDRTITYVPLDDLRGDDRNPKDHDHDAIAGSVGRFGYVEPVVVDGRTGLIVSGHGRTATLRAMRDRGDTPPNGVRVDDDGTWHAPVVTGWESSDDLEAAGALIALNRTTELGGWADEALLGLLDKLADDPSGLTGTGYSDEALRTLRSDLARLDEGEQPPDDFPDFGDHLATEHTCPRCGYDW